MRHRGEARARFRQDARVETYPTLGAGCETIALTANVRDVERRGDRRSVRGNSSGMASVDR